MTLREKFSYLFQVIGRALQPRCSLQVALEQRIAELERHPFRYVGTWEGGQYERGEFATHRGSLWHCNFETASRPGEDASWTLCVKKGRDAK